MGSPGADGKNSIHLREAGSLSFLLFFFQINILSFRAEIWPSRHQGLL